VLRRIQKLLAIANDSRANPEEAAAAASMAHKIMQKYQIDHAEVIMAEISRGDSMGKQPYTVKGRRKSYIAAQTWMGHIALQVARLNDVIVEGNCVAVSEDKWVDSYTFSGYQSDIQVAMFTTQYLINVVSDLVINFKKDYPKIAKKRRGITSYRSGVISAIRRIIEREIANKKAENASGAGYALIIVKLQAVERHFGKQLTRDGRKTKLNEKIWGKGFADGLEVDVTRRGLSASGEPVLALSQ
jgi:hypothetical protein